MDILGKNVAVHRMAPGRAGTVVIVGAGPGDPELLTVRALRFLQQADVVVYDRLVGDAVLDLAPHGCDRLFVGKRKGGTVMPQMAINALLVRQARLGRAVVRLKGGDPFIFGRGGEELDYLRRAGIETAVVPGITAATGCAASIGVPLTHRDHTSTVTFVSGHAAGVHSGIDWSVLAQGNQTLVFYMALSTARDMAAQLIAHGRDAATPVAIVENGTLASQRSVTGELRDLERLIRENNVAAPALIVVGAVAALAQAIPLPREACAV